MRHERLSDSIDLYLGDCRDIAPTLGRVGIAVVGDPPYGMNFNTDSRRFSGFSNNHGSCKGEGRADRIIHGDDERFDPSFWLSYDEVILWGSNHYAAKLPTGSTLIWLKRQPVHYGAFLSDAEIGWQKGGCGVYALHAPDSSGRRAIEAGARNPKGAGTAHPAQKPLCLMRWCIERTKSKKVIDPYMGSGSTGVAASQLGRKFIGIEKDSNYFDIACKRIDAVARQSNMFTETLSLSDHPAPAAQGE